MALTSCGECGKEISTLANTCPRCGSDIAAQYSFFYKKGCLFTLFWGGILYFIAFMIVINVPFAIATVVHIAIEEDIIHFPLLESWSTWVRAVYHELYEKLNFFN